MKLFLTLCLLAHTVFTGHAQSTVSIKGLVKDHDTQEPVAFASVVLYTASDTMPVKAEMTDSLGVFQFSEQAPGIYFLRIASTGYEEVSGSVFTATEGLTTDLGIYSLKQNSDLLKEVTITATQPAFERLFDRTVLHVDGNPIYSTASNVLDVLKRAPGIRVSDEGDLKLKNGSRPMVLIDDKPVPMSDDELANYLKTLPQDQIESIDIIDNPSAKYDATYKGVVNIKLKRDKTLGWKGSLSTSVLQNTFTAPGSSSLTLTYKTKKWAFYGNYAYNIEKKKSRGYLTQYFNNETQVLKVNADADREQEKHSAGFGTEYLINAQQTAGVQLKVYDNQGVQNAFTYNHLYTYPGLVSLSDVVTNNMQRNHYNNHSVNAYYNATLKKSSLSVNASYAGYGSAESQDITNTSQETVTARLRNFTGSDISIAAAQADYSYSFSKSRIEAGIKAASTASDYQLRYDTLSGSNAWIEDTGKSNQFVYNEEVLAAYATYAGSLGKKIQYSLGLRTEQTISTGHSLTTGSIVDRNYLRFLPSFNLGYSIREEESFDMAFSRRLERPSFRNLNPFRFYVNPYSYTEGNPFLQPVTVNMAGLNYTRKQVSVSANYVLYENTVSQIPDVDADNMTRYRFINFGNQAYWILGLSHAMQPYKWWNLQHYAEMNVYDQFLQYEGIGMHVRNVSFYVSGTQTFTLPKKWRINLSYAYGSMSKYNIFSVSDYRSLGVSFQKNLYHERLELRLAFEDVFYTGFTRNTANIGRYHASTYEKHDTRYVKLNILFRFGKSEYSAQKRNASSEDQENRLKK